MGRNGNGSWFSSIKKSLSTSSKEKKSQKSEKKGFVEENPSILPDTSIIENVGGSCDSRPFPQPEEVNPIEVDDEPPPKSSSSVAAATGAAVPSTSVAANMTLYSGKSMAEEAAIRIQTAFRGYLARRVLWDLRGLVRLKAVVEGPSVKRQTANTLKCTQNASHVQSQINSRRIRMSEENQALQRQLLLQRAKENLQNGDEWNYSVQSKEQMEAKLLSKYEATMRRERAMAYSFSHQQPWKKSTGPPNLLFMDPTNPQWGWSWSERYMAARPWEARAEKEPGNDHGSVKTGITITRNEIAKSYARHQLNSAPSTPRSKAGGPLASRKIKAGPSPQGFVSGVEANLDDDDDSRSIVSVRAERNRRHSLAGPMVKTDESLGGSPAARKHVVATKAAKVKAREKGLSENGGGSTAAASGGRIKKQLDFPGSPAKPRRHSGPPKVEASICNELE